MNYSEGCFVGRIWDSVKDGQCIVTIKGNYIYCHLYTSDAADEG